MKRKTLMIIGALLLPILAVGLCGCGILDGIINSPSIKYFAKIAEAKQYSYKLAFSEGENAPVIVDCYYQDESYAYLYNVELEGVGSASFREVFVGKTEYRILESLTLADGVSPEALNFAAGNYSKRVIEEDSDDTTSGNFVMAATMMMSALSVTTIMETPVQEELDGETCTKVSIALEGNTYAFWYNAKDLMVKARIFTSDEKEFNFVYSDYDFSHKNDSKFVLPDAQSEDEQSTVYQEGNVPSSAWAEEFLKNFAVSVEDMTGENITDGGTGNGTGDNTGDNSNENNGDNPGDNSGDNTGNNSSQLETV